MACYHPMLAKQYGFTASGAPNYKIIRKASFGISDLESDDMIEVPCGKCIGCRLDYSRQWADRLMLELDHSKRALFLTLTYDDENLRVAGAGYPTLVPHDMVLFVRRLRRAYPDREVRYFYSGEYGDKTFRPHYHGIFFDLELGDIKDLSFYKNNRDGSPLYISENLTALWGLGYVVIGSVSWHTCAYVARYVLKKLGGDAAEVYTDRDMVKPFSRQSRRPGIAGYFLQENPDFLDTHLFIKDIETVRPVKRITAPKYILKKLEKVAPEWYASIKEERARFARDRDLIKLMETDLFQYDLRKVEEADTRCKMRSFRDKI